MTNLQCLVAVLMFSGFFAMTFERVGARACLMGGGILMLSYFG